MTLQSTKDIVTFDPALEGFNFNILGAWMERLFVDNWTIAPSVFNFSTQFRPSDYVTGGLAASWEFTDPSTFVVHLRHGINWQNISPANGREFVASDVVAHYSRWFDPKIGYNKFSPHATSNYLVSLTALTAPDKYTVVFQWSTSNPEWVYECLMLSGTAENSIENPEAVAQWGDLNDWHHAIGTGPFILKDFVSGASATLVKNPNYWGYDERYPKNKLPYVDGITYLIISDPTTARLYAPASWITSMGRLFSRHKMCRKRTPK
jgi:peptide/nickel transport system substrate-binding protein